MADLSDEKPKPTMSCYVSIRSPWATIRPFHNIVQKCKNQKLKFCKKINRKLWSSGRALSSQSEGCGFNPRPVLDGSGVKAMPGSIPAPNSGSL